MMVIIKKAKVTRFIEEHPLAAEALLRWYLLAKEYDWADFADLKKTFPATDYVGNGLYVFNVGGNKFRIIARIIFRVRTIYLRFIGTHQDYDKVDLSGL